MNEKGQGRKLHVRHTTTTNKTLPIIGDEKKGVNVNSQWILPKKSETNLLNHRKKKVIKFYGFLPFKFLIGH